MEVSTSISGQHVTRVLDWLIKLRGKPKNLLTDNEPEFAGTALVAQYRPCLKQNRTLEGGLQSGPATQLTEQPNICGLRGKIARPPWGHHHYCFVRFQTKLMLHGTSRSCKISF